MFNQEIVDEICASFEFTPELIKKHTNEVDGCLELVPPDCCWWAKYDPNAEYLPWTIYPLVGGLAATPGGETLADAFEKSICMLYV
jgi:hypothetical protein